MSTRNLTDAEKAQLLEQAARAIRCANDVVCKHGGSHGASDPSTFTEPACLGAVPIEGPEPATTDYLAAAIDGVHGAADTLMSSIEQRNTGDEWNIALYERVRNDLTDVEKRLARMLDAMVYLAARREQDEFRHARKQMQQDRHGRHTQQPEEKRDERKAEC